MSTKRGLAPNRLSRHVAVLRIVFGVIWLADAALKWRPEFAHGFYDQVAAAAQGQPDWLAPWFHFWMHLTALNPHFFALITTTTESLIAVALLFGVARRTTYVAAAIFSLIIWAVPEGFGGPYTATSTDVGTGLIYAIVFFALYGLERLASPPSLALDNAIIRRFAWWKHVANPKPSQ